MSVVRIPKSSERVPALDGVRGFATLLIILFHLALLPVVQGDVVVGDLKIDQIFLRLTAFGWVGLDLFFVLSGFLITGILYESKGVIKRFFRTFYVRRALRTFPLYYAFLLFLLVFLPLILPSERVSVNALWKIQLWFEFYAQNIRYTIDPAGEAEVAYLVRHLWSLAVEEQFYLVWPLVVFLLPRRGIMAVCGALIVAAFGVRLGMSLLDVDTSVIFRFTPARMDGLAVGAFVALAIRDRGDLRALMKWAWPIALGSLIALAFIYSQRGQLYLYDGWVQIVGFTPIVLLFGLVVLNVATSGPQSLIHRAFAMPVLTGLGRYSYALYIFHVPVGQLLLRHAQVETAVPQMFGSALPQILFFILVAFSISMVGALVTWNLFEKRFLKLKDVLALREERPAPEPVAVVPSAKRDPALRVGEARPSEPPEEIEMKKAA